MYDQNLHIIQNGSSWRVSNPYRGGHDPDVRPPNRAHELAIVLPAAVVVAVGCAVLIDSAVLRLLTAVLAMVVAIAVIEFAFTARTSRHRAQQVADADALTATLGPAYLSRAAFVDTELRELADRAVGAATTIAATDAFDRGLLGPQQAVAGDLQIAVWDCLHALADLDQRAGQWRQARTQIDSHHLQDYRALSDRVHQELLGEADAAAAQVVALEDIRDGAATVDARLAEAVVVDHLERTLAGQAMALSDSPAVRLAAQVAAAHNVIDADGTANPRPLYQSDPPPSALDSGADPHKQ
ncbi:hypothetical protein ACFQNE_02865 [Gordonia phosphorivorans]|uniref:Integral membrane protein n=1 Tax=Gordonia phosphorivorans TaxID=1056982 RepID=A0ABV6H410_9ACTN